jgi:hypothetical protein
MTWQAEKAIAFVNLYQKQSEKEKIAAQRMEQSLSAAGGAQTCSRE